MAEHPVPEQLIKAVTGDLVSRVAEMGWERPDGTDEALAIFKALPEIDSETELEIDWYSEAPPASAMLRLDARHLLLSVSDEAGSQELYSCYAGFYPEMDQSDLKAWLLYFRTLSAPEVSITIWR